MKNKKRQNKHCQKVYIQAFSLKGRVKKLQEENIKKQKQNLIKSSIFELKKAQSLAGGGILSAVGLIINQFTIQIGTILEIGFSFVAMALTGFLYGPFVAVLCAFAFDLAGFMLRPNGQFFIGFTLNEMLAAAIYGFVLYKKPISLKRTFIACLLVVLCINLLLTPIWLNMLYGNAQFLSALRLVKNAVKLPVDTVLLFSLLKLTSKLKIQNRQE